MVDLAVRTVDWLDPPPLYARVDLVPVGSGLAVMELELIEPSLFLDHGPAGLEALERAIRRRLARRSDEVAEGPRAPARQGDSADR